MDMGSMEWVCHVCGRMRRDSDIGVRTFRSTTIQGMKFNVRYCRDNDDCWIGAQAVALKWNRGQAVTE
jgi:hypothetical protein